MSDNVIILGAGASFDAGIPLMAGFVEKMWEFAMRKRNGNEILSTEDIKIFEKAMEIRDEIDGYHGRAAFDNWNIEDILSILSFNIIGGKKTDKDKLDWMLKAISRTIELTCNVKYDDSLNEFQISGPDVYRYFWKNIFSWSKVNGSMPTIITFNYDLVLERSLFQIMRYKHYNEYDRFPFYGIKIKYFYDAIEEFAYNVQYAKFHDFFPDNNAQPHTVSGTYLEQAGDNISENFANIEILKLHGSINFPRRVRKGAAPSPTNAVIDPYILPPIFNKLSSEGEKKMWKIALLRLREAKNVIIVGYSLPRTDIYMQYFLKTALGPNINLNKIFVFDPVLFTGGKTADDMQDRYACCFSSQLKNRIIFRPQPRGEEFGTFEHFTIMLSEIDTQLLF